MHIIPRFYDNLGHFMKPARVTVLYGPRRVGKTTLVSHYIASRDSVDGLLQVTGDNIVVRDLFHSQNLSKLLAWAEGKDTIFIDEAQRIPGVGWGLKILIDTRPELVIIATGSASFDIASKLGEPLTGRQTPLQLFPIALLELRTQLNAYELQQKLADFLIYGMYPEVRTAQTAKDKRFILKELVSSYLFRDILEIDRIKHSHLLKDLLTLVALQVGSEVSLNELANRLHIDTKTVARYLDLFEKSFILYNIRGFSRNLRSEVTRTSKYYFYDTGVRNALIDNFNPPEKRNDLGGLWENFAVMELLKTRSYHALGGHLYFWRTWEQQEIDIIEDRGGKLYAYECKWNNAAVRKHSAPSQFRQAYPTASYTVVTPANLLKIIAPQ
jgi:predicted AAA+ superfamily ATPase